MPETSVKTQLGYLVHEVARLLRRNFENEARGHGITLTQWRALAQIAHKDSLSQRAIAELTDSDPMTVSGVLDRLEKRGLVERFPDPADSRAKLARLTDEGRALVARAKEVGLSMYEQALAGVSADEQAVVETILARMRDNLSGRVADSKEQEK